MKRIEVAELEAAIRAIEFVRQREKSKPASLELAAAVDSLKTAISLINYSDVAEIVRV